MDESYANYMKSSDFLQYKLFVYATLCLIKIKKAALKSRP